MKKELQSQGKREKHMDIQAERKNAMLKNRPKENDEQNAIDFILAEYKDISDGIVIDDTVDIGWPPAMVVVTDAVPAQ